MAREEMCPYSDVEFGFLLEDDTEENREYFRKLSQFLQLRIINLGETFFPVLRPQKGCKLIFERLSKTPRGFSLDTGGIAPLGKEGVYELICSPKQLANFHNPKWLEANQGETPLINALTQCAFVMGKENLLDQYITSMERTLNARTGLFFGPRLRESRAIDLLRGHLQEFHPWLTKDRIDGRGFNAKKDLYRPLQMIVGCLSLYYGISSGNTFTAIQELQKKVFSVQKVQKNFKKR